LSAQSPPVSHPASQRKGTSSPLPWLRTMRPPLRVDATFVARRLHSYRAGSDSLKLHYGTAPPLAPFRDQVVEARLRREQPFLETGPGSLLQPLPFFDWHQNGGLDSPPGNDLRSLLDGCIQKLTKTRFRVLHLPRSQASPPRLGSIILTSHLPSQLRLRGNMIEVA